MDFFAQQAKVRHSSRRLVVLFILAVVAVTAAVDVVVLFALGMANRPKPGVPAPEWTLDWPTLIGVSVGVFVLIGVASMYRVASLRGGGASVARGMGATPVPADTTNPVWQRLRDVIEEIAIAAGAPVPDIFILESEAGINAFAAGYTPSDAAVCVTQGCLDRLTRDELQGVIAHEFSHVLNGDMRLNIRLMGLLFGILIIGIVGRFMLFSGGRVRSRNSSGTASIAMIGIAVVVVGYIGFFFGRLIQAAVARSRESLADASAVQFTRQTSGIAGALKKIAALEVGSTLGGHNKQEVAHMLFGEPGRFSRLFATHPPLPDRIRALGVTWDEKEIKALAKAWDQPVRAADPKSASASMAGFAAGAPVAPAAAVQPDKPLPGADSTWNTPAGHMSDHVGQPDATHFALAGQLRRQLSPALVACTRQADKARALLLALAMDEDARVRDAQLLHIDSAMGSSWAEDAERTFALLADVHPMQRLPLASMALPSLRRSPRPQLEALVDMLDDLVRADHRVDLHEYSLVRLINLQLRDVLDPSAGFEPGSRRLHHYQDDFATLCAIVAAHGHDDTDAAQRAWAAAIQQTLPKYQGDYRVPKSWQAALDKALGNLDRLRAFDKQMVVEGLAVVVSEDGVVTLAEAELLRVICAALHCPLPPLQAQSVTTDQ